MKILAFIWCIIFFPKFPFWFCVQLKRERISKLLMVYLVPTFIFFVISKNWTIFLYYMIFIGLPFFTYAPAVITGLITGFREGREQCKASGEYKKHPKNREPVAKDYTLEDVAQSIATNQVALAQYERDKNMTPTYQNVGDMLTLGAFMLLASSGNNGKQHERRERRVIDEIHREDRRGWDDCMCDDFERDC